MLAYNLLGAFTVFGVAYLSSLFLDLNSKRNNIAKFGFVLAIIFSVLTFVWLNGITQKNEVLIDNIQFEKTEGSINDLKVPSIVIIGDESDEAVMSLKKPLGDMKDYTLIIQNPLDEVGKELIKDYNITVIPAILVSKNGYTYTFKNQEAINKELKNTDLLTETNIKTLIPEIIKKL